MNKLIFTAATSIHNIKAEHLEELKFVLMAKMPLKDFTGRHKCPIVFINNDLDFDVSLWATSTPGFFFASWESGGNEFCAKAIHPKKLLSPAEVLPNQYSWMRCEEFVNATHHLSPFIQGVVKLPARLELTGETDGNCMLNEAEMVLDRNGQYIEFRKLTQQLDAAGVKWE